MEELFDTVAFAMALYGPVPISLAWIWIYREIHKRWPSLLIFTCLIANVLGLLLALRSILHYHGLMFSRAFSPGVESIWWYVPYSIETVCVLAVIIRWRRARFDITTADRVDEESG